MTIITRTNGQPFATEASARQQLTAKGLQGTHEVVPHEGGYALVLKHAPNQDDEPITLRPGDYVSTADIADEDEYHAIARAFENAGAKGGLASYGIIKSTGVFGWSTRGCIGHNPFPGRWFDRLLTIDQVLGATNAGKSTAQPKEATMTATLLDTVTDPITTLKQARKTRDEADQAYQEALEEARGYLGEGFELTEVGTDGPLVGGEDMTDPANWREGDVLEWTGYTGKYFTRGKTYKINSPDSVDGDFSVIDDEGDDHPWDFGPAMGCFRFHHRPA